MISAPERNLLFLEVRNGETIQVEFFALDYKNNVFVWKNWQMKESWWVSLTAANGQTLLLHTFRNKGNPDHKNLIACDIFTQRIRWEVEEFSFYDWDSSNIRGYSTKNELTKALVNIESGLLSEMNWEPDQAVANEETIRPFKYMEGSTHFETVKRFIQNQVHKPIVGGVEYCEFSNWIITSVYFNEADGLANYLLVMTTEGEIVLNEKLAEKLEGLGVDTFFILSGCLFFVKNRLKLVAYTFYD